MNRDRVSCAYPTMALVQGSPLEGSPNPYGSNHHRKDQYYSYKAHFAEVLLAFQQQWQFDGLYVADWALYSEPNIQALTGLQWLARVSLSLTAAIDLVSTLPDSALHTTDMPGYRIASVCIDHRGAPTVVCG